MSVMPCMEDVRANILLPCKKTAKWGRRKSAPYALLCPSRHVFYAILAVVCMKNYLIEIDTNEIYLP